MNPKPGHYAECRHSPATVQATIAKYRAPMRNSLHLGGKTPSPMVVLTDYIAALEARVAEIPDPS